MKELVYVVSAIAIIAGLALLLLNNPNIPLAMWIVCLVLIVGGLLGLLYAIHD